MDIGDVIPLIVALLSPVIWTAIIQRRKTKAEAKEIEAKAKKVEAETTEIIQRITAEQLEQTERLATEKGKNCQQRIEELEKDNKSIKAQLIVIKRELKNLFDHYFAVVEGAHLLVSQVKRHKEEPCYTPPPIEVLKKRKLAFKDE